MKILEVDIERLNWITKPVQYKQIILPDESIFFEKGNRSVTYEYTKTIDQVRAFAQKNFTPVSQKKLYFFHGRKQIGEERIADYFQSKGYTVIQPEKCTLEEQLNFLVNCESFSATAGSAAHNMIFLKDNSEVTLIPRANYLTACHPALDNLHNLKVSYVDSTLSIFADDNKGPFCYILSENLRKHFGDEVTEKYTEDDFRAFLTYVKFARANSLNENSEQIKYLKDILPEFWAQLKTRDDLLKKFGVILK